MADKFLSKLSQNFLEILNDQEYYDITIEVGEDSYKEIFRTHMVILYYRSPYLRRILSTNKKKSDGTLVHIKLPNISPEIFREILRYIYGGSLLPEEYETLKLIKILEAACELSLQELISCLQYFLIKNKAVWVKQNLNLVYQMSFKHNSLSDLQKCCINLVSDEPEKIFNSHDLISIPEKFLISLIKSDCLQASEVQVWEHVLRWGLAQNPKLSSDLTSFSKDDFNALKNSLKQCIPFVRFYNLTSEEFSDKVIPYKKVLPKDLYADLLKYFLNPKSVPDVESKPRIIKKTKSIDSNIITFQHAELISRWIDRLEISDELTSQYEFKLLFRGSHDGFTNEKFHEFCDNKARTVVIIKVDGHEKIVGGYNPIAWKSGIMLAANNDSFIFSFDNNSCKDYILSRVIKDRALLLNSLENSPKFDTDLMIWRKG